MASERTRRVLLGLSSIEVVKANLSHLAVYSFLSSSIPTCHSMILSNQFSFLRAPTHQQFCRRAISLSLLFLSSLIRRQPVDSDTQLRRQLIVPMQQHKSVTIDKTLMIGNAPVPTTLLPHEHASKVNRTRKILLLLIGVLLVGNFVDFY